MTTPSLDEHCSPWARTTLVANGQGDYDDEETGEEDYSFFSMPPPSPSRAAVEAARLAGVEVEERGRDLDASCGELRRAQARKRMEIECERLRKEEDADRESDVDFTENLEHSDEEVLPMAPPLVPSNMTLLRPAEPGNSPGGQADFVDGVEPIENGWFEGENEEEEWTARQRLTGAICRLVRYSCQDSPKDDIIGLRCTRRGRVIVTAVREHGVAWRANVGAGDELVSIDGRKEFAGHPAQIIHASFRAPSVLVFLGFVGRLQAEVRVRRPPEPSCGLPSGAEVVKAPSTSQEDEEPSTESVVSTTTHLADAVVFSTQGCTSVLLETDDREVVEEKRGLYELGREDARGLLSMALVEAIRDSDPPAQQVRRRNVLP